MVSEASSSPFAAYVLRADVSVVARSSGEYDPFADMMLFPQTPTHGLRFAGALKCGTGFHVTFVVSIDDLSARENDGPLY